MEFPFTEMEARVESVSGFFFFAVLGLELRAFTLSHSSSHFL
jgi:hypothetical protein